MQFVILWLFSLFTMASFKRANKVFELGVFVDLKVQMCNLVRLYFKTTKL